MIKILYVVGSSAFGGAVKHVVDLCSRLDRSQFDLACISPPDGPLPDELVRIGVRPLVIDLYRYSSPITWGKVISSLRCVKPDIVHAHGPSAFLFAAFSSPFSGRPLVVSTVHSLYLQEKIGRMALPALGLAKARLFASLERWAARRADQLIFVSEADRKGYCGPTENGFRAVTIPNGIDLSRFAPGAAEVRARRQWGIEPGEKVVGCVARLSPEKGLAYLLRAFPKIVASHQDARLMIVGDGGQRAELERIARTAGIDHRVVFTGHSSNVPGLLSAMDVVVLPSLWEGQPLAVLEAWAMEKPVVATRVRGTCHLISDGETGILVSARDPDSLASAVSRVLSDPQVGDHLGKAGRRIVETRFDLDRTSDQVAELYLRLARKRIPAESAPGGRD